MLDKRRLVVDSAIELYSLLSPYIAETFCNFDDVVAVPNSVYVFGRQQLLDHKQLITNMSESGMYVMVFCNVTEGSWTLQSQIQMLGIEDLIKSGKILLISGGEQQSDYHYVQYDHFLSEILKYDENLLEIARTEEIFSFKSNPYKFLFLNGRARPHRKYLFERFRQLDLLKHSLWTMLDSRPIINSNFVLFDGDKNLMSTNSELQWLPANYEVTRYNHAKINPGPANRTFVKQELFNNAWGEIYLQAEPYIDTYFSLVTETVVEQPWPFRTEKIAKPLMMGHPFIVATSPGYYQGLHQLGFQTFGHVIDESFDNIENHQDRMDRIVDIVADLCQQDLALFQKECYNVCKYNQQHLQELVPQLQAEFPEKFFKLINHE